MERAYASSIYIYPLFLFLNCLILYQICPFSQGGRGIEAKGKIKTTISDKLTG